MAFQTVDCLRKRINISIINEEAIFILRTLNEAGYQAYLCGGAVRDIVLSGRCSGDWDITTSATPSEVMQVFKGERIIPTGIKHGTVTIMMNNPIEITTFRKDGTYSDGRRPDSVEFVADLQEDMYRRDFTINSLALGLNGTVIDYFDGVKDISEGIIRTVGNPRDRFSEDYLRMLRAIRFASQLNFTLHKNVEIAIWELSSKISEVASERVQKELNRILTSNEPSKGFIMLHNTGLLKFLLPELENCFGFEQHNVHHNKTVFEHIMAVMDATLPHNLPLRLAALLHDIGKPEVFSQDEEGEGHFYGHDASGAFIAKGILRRLHYDHNTIELVSTLVREHMSRENFLSDKGIKRLIRRVGEDHMGDLFDLKLADIIGSKQPRDFSGHYRFRERVKKILDERQPTRMGDLAINGKDVMETRGIAPGPMVGLILKELLDLVMDDPQLNTREELLNIVKRGDLPDNES